ncbi:MAG TPA: UvrD-helicase domain-containing protein, partial [Phycicoccus sp.]|nr:UvrD-helicase domain-containing protein [Phycicoccus sp.]
MSADAILAALDPEQRAVAEAPQGPMVVLAGAGTGKT